MATQLNPVPVMPGLTGIPRRLALEGALTETDARAAVDEAARQKQSVTTYLVENGLVDGLRMTQALSAEFGVPMLDISAIDVTQLPMSELSEELIEKHTVLPLLKRGNRLFVGMHDPANPHALEEIKFHTNCAIEPVLIEAEQLKRGIEQAQNAQSISIGNEGSDDDALEGLTLGEDDDESSPATVDGNATDDAPVVKYVNKILLDAIKRGASDIHFEPYENRYRVRVRLDGVLKAVSSPPLKLAPRIASRLKVMARLDIAERRVPQDGRMKLNLSKTKSFDFRVSTLPTLGGEKIVLRILDAGAAKLGIEKLGYEPDQKDLFVNAINKPYGMVLVTGPTGSGKTVSLYTALNILNTVGRNISTVEDPVEIRVDGINQVQHNDKRGMTFAAALRSFLRQDPDVIMVGEIRDPETAEIAVKAAQTGHLVLSTVHTNDTSQTVTRLMNMGIAPYNLTSSVLLVIAQRLVRRLHDCKKPLDLPRAALLAEGFTEADIDHGLTLYDAVGCPGCNEGYKGRTGIYEVMPMTEEIQKIILEGGNALQIAEVARRSGVRNLRQSALMKVKQGITSLAEIDRVTQD
ncbi:MAG TPA: type IV-A pilus assembly ATPase PilB [Rhodanobacteraceae bacterium]